MGAPLEATNSTAGLLELCVVKATCTVLRGGDVSDDISLPDLVEELMGKGIGFRSLQDGAIDTTTASGELMVNIFSSLAQFE